MTWGVRPSVAIALLVGAAALLLVFPAVLALGLGRRLWRRWRKSRLERMTPLQRSLELLKRAAAGGEAQPSRRALERVARELGDNELGADARRLAWSRSRPDAQSMDSLRDRVEDGG
jgi:Flp pilus assembly protein TadB